MVERDDHIKFTAEGTSKKCVAGQTQGKSGELRLKVNQSGVDQIALFMAEQTFFTGMGIETADANARCHNTFSASQGISRRHGSPH